jgi:hypothetical protein
MVVRVRHGPKGPICNIKNHLEQTLPTRSPNSPTRFSGAMLEAIYSQWDGVVGLKFERMVTLPARSAFWTISGFQAQSVMH